MIKHTVRGALAIGYLFCAAACAEECLPLKVDNLSDVYAQLGAIRERAYVQYFLGQPETSVESLKKLAEMYARAQCTDVVPDEVRSAFGYDELLERGRLARVYQKLGDAAKAAPETRRAVSLGRVVFKNSEWSAADLSRLVTRLDEQVGEEVRAVSSGKSR